MTGLSGVEDIVGEMISAGELNPRQVGLSDEQGQNLTDRARYSPSWHPDQSAFTLQLRSDPERHSVGTKRTGCAHHYGRRV